MTAGVDTLQVPYRGEVEVRADPLSNRAPLVEAHLSLSNHHQSPEAAQSTPFHLRDPMVGFPSMWRPSDIGRGSEAQSNAARAFSYGWRAGRSL